MAILTYQSEDGTVQDTVRCALDDKPKFIVRNGKRLYPMRCSQPPGEGYQLSESNGIIGTKDDLRRAMKRDAELGVPIKYRMVNKGHGPDGKPRYAWKAEFKGNVRTVKNNWLRAHNRFDADAGYSDPAPGYTNGKFPGEFEG